MQIVSSAEEFLEPKAIARIFKVHKINHNKWNVGGYVFSGKTIWRVLEDANFCSIAVTTIGADIENKINIFFKKNDNLKAIVYDAFASEAVEEFTNLFHSYICRYFLKFNLMVSRRVSPGYGDFSIEEQVKIFKLIEAEKIGVKLSESKFMIPRKSVSFIAGIGDNLRDRGGASPCKSCFLKNCPYRRKN